MKKSFILMIVILSGVTLNSCKDDNIATSKEELLTNTTWVVKSKTITPPVSFEGFVISDIMALEPDSVQNYSFKYDKDGSLIQYDYLNHILFQTTWSFNSDQTQITHNQPIIYNYPIVGDLGITTIRLESLTTDLMTAEIPFLYEDTNYVVKIIFKSK